MKNMLAFMEDRRLRFLLVPWVMELAAEVYPEVDAAVEHFCDKHPDLKHRYGQEYIGRILLRVLRSEEPAKSLEYQSLFHTLNTMYFGGRLPEYWIRAVYDIDAFLNTTDWSNIRFIGFIAPEIRTIYLRISSDESMRATLIHEMAHASTTGDHDERFWAEMRRLQAVGAPVDERDFTLPALGRKQISDEQMQVAA